MSTTKNFKLKNTLPLWGVLVVLMVFSCQDLEPEESFIELKDEYIISNSNLNIVPGQYIITLHDQQINFRKTKDFNANQINMRLEANRLLDKYGIPQNKVIAAFGSVLPVFGAQLTEEEFLFLKKDPIVKSIIQDIYLHHAFQRQNPPRNNPDKDDKEKEGENDNLDESVEINWGQDRIDQRSLPLDGIFERKATGKEVEIFIIDSGISEDHEEFKGRLFPGPSFYEGSLVDCNGHGTPVAGLAGGKRFGVANEANLISCRIFPSISDDCENNPTSLSYFEMLDWIAVNKKEGGLAVVNMSFISVNRVDEELKESWEDIHTYFKDRGLVFIAAAGNQADDACYYIPAGLSSVFAVGASQMDDLKAGFSNWGSCIDIFAPGVFLKTASSTGTAAYWEDGFGGTSAASPIVAGVAALYLEQNPNASVDAVYDFLRNTSTKNVIRFSDSQNNNLIYSLLSIEGADENTGNENPYSYQLNLQVNKGSGQRWFVNMNWSPYRTEDTHMDIYEDGNLILTTQNWGGYSLEVSGRNLPPRTYIVCKSGTNECSNEAVAVFK
jgi:subtilisin family serine protease